MSNSPRLRGFGVTGYRSLSGEDLQCIAPLSKVHLVAGPNNAGKSNILAVAQRLLPTLGVPSDLSLQDTDRPANVDGTRQRLRLAVAREVSDDDLTELFRGRGAALAEDLARALRGPSFQKAGSDLTWFEFEPEADNPGRQTNWRTSAEQLRDVHTAGNTPGPTGHRLQDLSSVLTGAAGGNQLDDATRVMQQVVDRLAIKTALPTIATVGAFRQITKGGDGLDSLTLDGTGLIERLARLERPAYSNWADRERFGRITNFVRTLLADPEAGLSIPQDADDVLVTHHGLTLPLQNYGTGVQQIVILAAAATALTDHLICIEEPEIHLHPTMQRTLLRYLVDQTENQYLIATHSAHLLDAGRASISAVRMVEAATIVSPAVSPRDVADVSAGLGFRASDLVQSNAVVWVEGPSDRTYLRCWISLVAPDLVDGIHYSLMFYGGGLLKHLSPNDPGVDEFIALPRINRNFAVVIDSDKTSSRKSINATKRRVKAEVESAGPQTEVWITKGYTIENYVPPETLAAAVKAVHPGTTCSWNGSCYENPLGESQISGSRKKTDKPAVAQHVVANWPTGVWPFDLHAQIEKVVAMIRAANGR